MASDPSGPCLLPTVPDANGNPSCHITGAWTAPPNPWNTCYCQGDLYLADNTGPATVSGVVVIFVQGQTWIGNNILMNNMANDWMAVASEGNVTIEKTVPTTLTLNGTFLTDGSMNVQNNTTFPTGILNFTGGIISQNIISLGSFQQSRNYAYHSAPTNMRLPFLVQSLTWTIRHGRNY